MRRILVAHDGSKPASHAAAFAAELARTQGAALTLMYVVPPYTYAAEFYGHAVADLSDRHVAYAEKMLAAEAEKLRAEGHRTDAKVVVGVPADELALEADAEEVWMVVAGSSADRSRTSRALLGSTADRLAHTCRKPILLVR